MRSRHDSKFTGWRRRAQHETRDIAIAVVLTVLTAGLLGVAWLSADRPREARVGHSASIEPR